MGHSLQLPLDVEHANNREQYEAWREQLNMRISEFVEEHELTFGIMALLLVDLGISSRMIDYLLTTASLPARASNSILSDFDGKSTIMFAVANAMPMISSVNPRKQ